MSNPRLPFIRALEADLNGWAFFLCTQKEMRQGRTGEPFMSLMLQDKTGFIKGRVLNDAVRLRDEFDSGEFVKVQARTDFSNGRLQLVVERIRRINPDQDAQQGFREEDYVMCAARPVEEMWDELQELVAHVQDPFVRELLRTITTQHAGKLRTQIEHLVVSHHGHKEFGAPVEPMTIEAMILSAADDLDAKINQVRSALAEEGVGEFTAYHNRLGRVLWRG